MTTIRDVAKRADVAICTVSRVLNGRGNVAEGTRKRIEAAMRELNYVPNELARGMFKKRSGIIAMLVPDIKHLYFSTLASCIEMELRALGYRLMLCATGNEGVHEQEQMSFLRTNLVDGVISGVATLDEQEYRNFNKPLVMLDCDLPGIPFVVSDHLQGGHLMADYMVAAKRQCVAQLIYTRGRRRSLSSQRSQVFGEDLEAAGIHHIPLEMDWNALDFYDFVELAENLIKQYPQLDGFMASDIPAAAFLKVARKRGLEIPKDCSILACDGTYVVSSGSLEITSVVQDLPRIARQAVAILRKILEGEAPHQRENIIPVLLHEGETT